MKNRSAQNFLETKKSILRKIGLTVIVRKILKN